MFECTILCLMDISYVLLFMHALIECERVVNGKQITSTSNKLINQASLSKSKAREQPREGY